MMPELIGTKSWTHFLHISGWKAGLCRFLQSWWASRVECEHPCSSLQCSQAEEHQPDGVQRLKWSLRPPADPIQGSTFQCVCFEDQQAPEGGVRCEGHTQPLQSPRHAHKEGSWRSIEREPRRQRGWKEGLNSDWQCRVWGLSNTYSMACFLSMHAMTPTCRKFDKWPESTRNEDLM